jgi:uncharacterized protein with ParB-like and HNH nuclease domain
MTTNSVFNRNFKELFDMGVRYEIPFFQRGYAWQTRQWKKLFEDLQTEVIDNVTNNRFEDEEHFFGPIVVLEKISNHPVLKRFLVIDGQQRITTVYLLLAIIRRLFEAKAHISDDAQKYIVELDHLLKNNLNDTDDYLKIKVFSSKGDRLPTYKSVFGKNPQSPFLSHDQYLYNPDENKIDAFVKYATRQLKNADVPELYNWYQAVLKSLKIVWIPLDEKKDDAQAIFESLNDAGMPLSASELLCNYIFKPLANEEDNEHERLHNELWLTARGNVGENIFEEYLRDLFSIGERKRVGKERRMYVHFKVKHKNLSKKDARDILQKILDYTKVYNQISAPIQHPHDSVEVKNLLIAIHSTNMTSIYPFLMEVLKAHENQGLTLKETIDLLRETYVLLVRRKISSLPVTRYDSFFPALLDKIINEPNKVKAFQKQAQNDQLWVPDETFEDAFVTKEIYNSRELNFTRHVLQEIDKHLQTFGEYPDYSTISTVEHVLPQTLNDHWKNYLGGDAYHYSLPTITNTIGNLCLNSRPANSSFGQKSFNEKKELYTDLSALAKDVKDRNDPWNIQAIQSRSKDLAQEGLEIWKWKVYD